MLHPKLFEYTSDFSEIIRYAFHPFTWCNMPYLALKDIFFPPPLFKADNRYNYLLSTNLLQVGLREHSNASDTLRLGEDDSISAKTHWSRLETIAIDTNWLYTIYSSLVTVPKAWGGKCIYSLVSMWITSLFIHKCKNVQNSSTWNTFVCSFFF